MEPEPSREAPGGGEPRAASITLVGDSLTVAAWTVVSRVMGFVKVVVAAAVLGPTYLGNTYQALNSLPNLLSYGVLAGALFPSLLVPPLVRHIDARDFRASERVAGGFLGVAMLVFGAVAVAAMLAGPVVLRALSLGVEEGSVAAVQQRVGWPLLVMLMPQVVLYGIVGTGAAVMNAHGRFALPAAAPALESIGIAVTFGAYAVWFGRGTPLEEVETAQLVLLGLGTTGAVGMHAGVQWFGARRSGVTLIPRAGWRDPEVRDVLRRATPSVGYGALVALQFFGALVVANSVPGGVVAFQLAWNLFTLPSAIAARPIASALLPRLARIHHLGDRQHFRDELVRGLRLALFLTVPAAMACLALASPLARSVSFGEMATHTGVTLVTGALAALALGVIGESCLVIATNASYAQGDARSPFVSVVVQTLVVVLGMMVALSLGGTAVLVVLGLSLSTASLAASAHLMLHLRSRLPVRGEPIVASVARTVLASAAMVGPAYLVAVFVPTVVRGQWTQLVGMVLATVLGAAIFVAVERLWKSPELTMLLAGFGHLPGSIRKRSS